MAKNNFSKVFNSDFFQCVKNAESPCNKLLNMTDDMKRRNLMGNFLGLMKSNHQSAIAQLVMNKLIHDEDPYLCDVATATMYNILLGIMLDEDMDEE